MKEKENEDLAFLKQKAGEAKTEVPSSLSRETIEKRIAGETQQKRRFPVRAVVSVAAAACVLLTSAFVLRKTVLAPKPAVYAPVGAVQNGSAAAPAAAGDYAQIAQRLEKARQNGLRDYDDAGSYYSGMKDAADFASEEAVATAPAAESAAGANADGTIAVFSKTNLRTEGVLEADVMKTDGRYLYYFFHGQILIVDPAGEMKELASIELYKGFSFSSEFYLLDGYRLLTVSGFWDETSEKSVTELRLFDVGDAAAPRQLRSIRFDGFASSSRVIGDRMLLVTNYDPSPQAFKAEDYTTFVPSYTVNEEAACYLPAESIYLGDDDNQENSFTTVTFLDLAAPDFAPKTSTLLGYAGELYCAADAMYLYHEVWEETNAEDGVSMMDAYTCIRKFDLSGDTPVLTAEGRVPGWVGDGFCMDAYNGYLRVAAQHDEETAFTCWTAD